MKTILWILAASLNLFGTDDLGVITPRRAIQIDLPTTRSDFHSFRVELLPAGMSNGPFTLTVTNSLLRAEDMSFLPSGRVTIGVAANFKDGSQSDLAIGAFDLRRGKPPAPTLRPMALSAPIEEPNSLTNELRARRVFQGGNIMPPIPATDADFFPTTNQFIFLIDRHRGMLATNDVPTESLIEALESRTGSNIVFVPRPLPGSTNQTYAEYLDWMADRKGKRRNE